MASTSWLRPWTSKRLCLSACRGALFLPVLNFLSPVWTQTLLLGSSFWDAGGGGEGGEGWVAVCQKADLCGDGVARAASPGPFSGGGPCLWVLPQHLGLPPHTWKISPSVGLSAFCRGRSFRLRLPVYTWGCAPSQLCAPHVGGLGSCPGQECCCRPLFWGMLEPATLHPFCTGM